MKNPEKSFYQKTNAFFNSDIYSALDNVRRSPWMSNIQTMLLLLNDKDGVETIGKILQVD